jgi:uncharacterized protein YoxC
LIVIVYVSVAVIALAFVVLVYHVSKVLQSVQRTLNNTVDTLGSLEQQLDGITKETVELLHRTNRLADDVERKTQALNPFFDSVKGVGDSIQTVNQTIRSVSNKVSNETERQSEQISQVVQWSNVVFEIWEKWKGKKKRLT